MPAGNGTEMTAADIRDATMQSGANRYLGKPFELLTEREQAVMRRLISRHAIAHDSNQSFDAKLTASQRLADKVAEFGGSWTFIILFGFVLALWVAGNLLAATRAFDPYPFIFLNLILSMLAAVQAPVIMMSQNRHAAKDRVDAAHDYEVNLKAEIEIMALHDKLDELRNIDLKSLVAQQEEQIALLTKMISGPPEQQRQNVLGTGG
ncbi:putative membrane protein [Rhizobium leguminosarum bv. trifolii WSM2297]|uniref:Putative membrane protein n=2 Tax=Rhizobium leguminosarum TaxID=384 RepID=J0WFR0_RHILT|nr:putative membrane protein [Rhizobium leguminosarum bv. trifolii WSM2297]